MSEEKSTAATPEEPAKTYLDFEVLQKVEIRVGEVVSAERVAGSKGGKLLKLDVDFGESTHRTVVSGIGLTFDPYDLAHKQFAFITNLAPRKMMGIESQAMILAAGEPENLSLCQLFGKAVKNGDLLG